MSPATHRDREGTHFLQRYLRICSKYAPEKFYDPGQSVPIGKLIETGNTSSIVEEVISKAIDSKMRESHQAIIDWIIGSFDLSHDASSLKSKKVYLDFVEVCQRRHLLSHTGGIVNAEYLKKCEAAGIDVKDLPAVGEEVEVSPQYIRKATGRVYLVGYFMLQLFIQKNFSNHRYLSHSNMLQASHAFLECNRTKMALRIIDFAEYSKKYFDNDLRLKFAINRALASLFDPNLDRDQQTANSIEVLGEYDWSVSTPLFDLALACCRRDFRNILELARKAKESGLEYSDARTFVVFREAREIDGFLECFPRQPLAIEASKL